MNYDELQRQIAVRGDVRMGEGASADEVRESELRLGVHFPALLREYLSRFGWLEIAGRELFGLGCGVPRFLDLTTVTLTERDTTSGSGLPSSLIPLLNDGMGNFYCVAADGSVVYWDNDAVARHPEEVATDLISWIGALLNDLDRG